MSVSNDVSKAIESIESGKSSWQTFATFIVSVQSRQKGEQTEQRTITYLLEADKRKIWPGVEFNGVYKLMLDQLQQVLPSPQSQAPAEQNLGSATRAGKSTAKEAAAPTDSNGVSGTKVETTSKDKNLAEEITEKPAASSTPNDDSDAPVDRVPESTIGKSPSPAEAKKDESAPERKSPSKEITEKPVALSTPKDDRGSSSDKVSEANAVSAPIKTDKDSVGEDELSAKDKGVPEEEVEEFPKLKITQLKIYQPIEEEKAEGEDTETEKAIVVDVLKRSVPSILPKEKPFDLEVSFQLSGTNALGLTKRSLPYHVAVYGQNRTTKEKLTLGKAPAGKLIDGELTYTCRVSDVTLSQPGVYSLQIINQLEKAPVSPDFLELNSVQVA